MVGCGVAGVLGAVGPGRPRDRHTRACGLEWSISKPALALRTLRRPPHRRRLRCCVWWSFPSKPGQALPPPTSTVASPRRPRCGLLSVGICGSSELSVGERVLVGGEHEGRQQPRRHPSPASITRTGTPQQQPFRPAKVRQHTPRSKPLGRLPAALSCGYSSSEMYPLATRRWYSLAINISSGDSTMQLTRASLPPTLTPTPCGVTKVER